MATTVTVAIFVLTYVLIAVRRLRILPIGRPAGALLGATLMVVCGAITPAESFRAIDGDTILLLFAMMLLTAELSQTGFFEWASARTLARYRTPLALLTAISLFAASASAFFVNDTICLFMTPIVVAACRRARLPMGPYLVMLATSANLGSAATLVGNPQNMLIGSLSQLPFAAYLVASLPAVLLALGLHILLARRLYARMLAPHPAWTAEAHADAPTPRGLVPIAVVFAGVVVAFFAGAHLGYAALAGATVLMLFRFRAPDETFRRVDWSVLVFFAALCIVTRALAQTGIIEDLWRASAGHLRLDDAGGVAAFTGLMTLGSNIVSNVPMVLLTGPYLPELGDPAVGYVLLGFVTTIAGNLTLVGSVANIIVAEGARDHHTLGFVEYLRLGLPSTLIALVAGVTTLVWWAPLALSWFA